VISSAAPELHLLGGFELVRGASRLRLPDSAQRVLAYLALRRRPVTRAMASTTLWIDHPEDRAGANLRTAIWLIRRTAQDVVALRGSTLALAAGVVVDVEALVDRAHVLVRQPNPCCDHHDIDVLRGELLPEWDEDWLILERERLRQLRMHALEALCVHLSSVGQHADAIEAGLAAVESDPLRESAQRALIGAHLAEGNPCEAIRAYRRFHSTIIEALGVEPTAELRAIVEPFVGGTGPR
jgi:DNA-binding SARP family transcriptional activator